ncbi:MAG: helix-turn-helix transcriptional regulator [Bacteroidota bacterium]|nr:helix-turn-helix transcriptional regulator [Bacteroidota bacterium]MDX5428393.1 helix-turn-helix transcriptional regulator [Bacteroidota bacterium]MDX5446828.1 helix-turn-helix transcriptional regulator [Bacteroidota bacterium]MDX5506166.1 helix-turn-helix transcriptional regulator [Bacteroidota bacterium]
MKKVEIKSERFDEMVETVKKYGGCPVSATLKIIGGKWKPLILYFISVDVNRFGLLQRMIPGCSKRMMTAHLRELERDGIIDRKVFAEVPPKVIYSLTDRGETLRPIFRELSKWGKEHVLEPKMKDQ